MGKWGLYNSQEVLMLSEKNRNNEFLKLSTHISSTQSNLQMTTKWLGNQSSCFILFITRFRSSEKIEDFTVIIFSPQTFSWRFPGVTSAYHIKRLTWSCQTVFVITTIAFWSAIIPVTNAVVSESLYLPNLMLSRVLDLGMSNKGGLL